MANNSNLSNVANVVSKYLQRSNLNVSYIPYTTMIQLYLAWYRGVNEWHKYKVWNGLKRNEFTRASLNMAKTVCEDLASLTLNEKCSIQLTDAEAQEFIDKTLEYNNFKVEGNHLCELMYALGTGAFVESWCNDKVFVDYIHGDMIFPLSWDNGKILECAFVKVGGNNKQTCYTIIMHQLETNLDTGKKEYVIRTVEVDKDGSVVRPMQIADGLRNAEGYTSVFHTHSDLPLFQIIKPNIVNNYDKTNPLGMSIFGNAIDTLKSIDLCYDSLANEFKLGKKRVFIKSGLKTIKFIEQKDAKNTIVDHVDPNDVLFYQLNTDDNEGKLPIQAYDPLLRVADHSSAIDMLLKVLSRTCGLGENYYAFINNAVARTATEIISTNSSLFRNIKKQELVLDYAIKGMCRAILYLNNLFAGTNYNIEQKITIDFDDSIIEDTEAEKQQAMAEYNAGLIDQIEYFVLTRDMTREKAQEFVAKMKATDTMKEVSNILNGQSMFGV